MSTHPMKVRVSPEHEELIRRKIDSGEHHSVSDVIAEALALLEEREVVRRWRTEKLRRDLQVAVDELDRGEGVPFDPEDIKREGRKRLAANKRER